MIPENITKFPLNIMINGLPGRVATIVSKYVILNKDLELYPYSLTGNKSINDEIIIDNVKINLVKSNKKDKLFNSIKKPDLIIDFTTPLSVKGNIKFYCENNIPFIIGTTGFDRQEVNKIIKDYKMPIIIAPNMAKQIVIFQAMIKYIADTFPNSFKDYTLEVLDSHQSMKKDVSGTAKSIIEYFNTLGIPFKFDQIKIIRDKDEQLKLGVPKEYLESHGYHTYTLKSKDENVLLEFKHNVNGIDVYAQGTIDAIYFLSKKIEKREVGIYTMIDVLKGD